MALYADNVEKMTKALWRETREDAKIDTASGSLEDLAMCCLGHKNMLFVYEKRKELPRKEHSYTLLAKLNLARLKSVGLGQHAEAEVMMREGIKRFPKAEEDFTTLIDKKWYKNFADEDGDHPGRLCSLWLSYPVFGGTRQGRAGARDM
ncbi:hypothetical protein B0H67DRAFT_640783 [Lasiosphaeris hirsuta]|uniref:Uncharacterized protein n=1 Tax=Lasiosphaeris hirsuta TaxID=260670 RepID=A0AA40E1A0_9PEZI|nr:hypothetical protein B0H67DRAFT_640783 [Lasiosphaeris hirsuta]